MEASPQPQPTPNHLPRPEIPGDAYANPQSGLDVDALYGAHIKTPEAATPEQTAVAQDVGATAVEGVAPGMAVELYSKGAQGPDSPLAHAARAGREAADANRGYQLTDVKVIPGDDDWHVDLHSGRRYQETGHGFSIRTEDLAGMNPVDLRAAINEAVRRAGGEPAGTQVESVAEPDTPADSELPAPDPALEAGDEPAAETDEEPQPTPDPDLDSDADPDADNEPRPDLDPDDIAPDPLEEERDRAMREILNGITINSIMTTYPELTALDAHTRAAVEARLNDLVADSGYPQFRIGGSYHVPHPNGREAGYDVRITKFVGGGGRGGPGRILAVMTANGRTVTTELRNLVNAQVGYVDTGSQHVEYPADDWGAIPRDQLPTPISRNADQETDRPRFHRTRAAGRTAMQGTVLLGQDARAYLGRGGRLVGRGVRATGRGAARAGRATGRFLNDRAQPVPMADDDPGLNPNSSVAMMRQIRELDEQRRRDEEEPTS